MRAPGRPQFSCVTSIDGRWSAAKSFVTRELAGAIVGLGPRSKK